MQRVVLGASRATRDAALKKKNHVFENRRTLSHMAGMEDADEACSIAASWGVLGGCALASRKLLIAMGS